MSARAADLCVDSYPSIQDAINAADDGGSVRLPVGRYTETLTITESITLQGGWNSGCTTQVTSDPALTVIDGDRQGSVVSITGGAPEVQRLTLTGGSSVEGGGVYVYYASLTLDRALVSGNIVTSTVAEPVLGAGVCAFYGTLVVSHTDVVSNVSYAPPGREVLGVGISVWRGTLVLSHTNVISNVAYAREVDAATGGGVYSNQSTCLLHATRIAGNTHSGQAVLRGGGIGAAESDVACSDTRSVIAHNQAEDGGGIYMDGYSTVSGCSILSNTARNDGGGIAVFRFEGGAASNVIVAGNTAGSRGSGMYVRNASVEIANNTLVGNSGGVGTAVEIGDSGAPAITLTNNIVVGHRVGVLNSSTTISPTLVTNDLWDNDTNYEGVVTGTMDVHVDPGFVDAASGDYHLAEGSPVIDAGTTLSWVDRDFDGDPRPIGAFHDIGADEWGRFVYLPLVMRAHTP